MDPGLMALNWLGGIQVAELNDDATGAARSTLIRELGLITDRLREEHGKYDPELNPDGIMTLGEMREAGEIAEKDRLMEAMLYSWSVGPDGKPVWDEKLMDQRMQNLVPAEVLRAMGIDPGDAHRFNSASNRPELAEDDVEGIAARNEKDLADAIRAFETWRKKPLTDEEKMTFLVASPWAPSNEMLEGLGIEPYRPRNRFDRKDEEPPFNVQLDDARAALDRLASSVGLDTGTVQSLRPRLSEFQRILNEASAAGVPRDRLIQYVVNGKDEGGGGVLSRNDRAFINQLLGFKRDAGPVPLSTTRKPTIGSDDMRKIQNKAWEAREEFLLFSQLYGLPRPTPEQVETYVMNSIMTAGTLDDMGYTDLKGAPNREDIRTDEEKYLDSTLVNQAGRLGLTQGYTQG